MTNDREHPEQDPAEGSRETIERDLAQQDKRVDKGRRNHAPSHPGAKPTGRKSPPATKEQ